MSRKEGRTACRPVVVKDPFNKCIHVLVVASCIILVVSVPTWTIPLCGVVILTHSSLYSSGNSVHFTPFK